MRQTGYGEVVEEEVLVLLLQRIHKSSRGHLARVGVLTAVAGLLRTVDALLAGRPLLEGASPALHDLEVVDT